MAEPTELERFQARPYPIHRYGYGSVKTFEQSVEDFWTRVDSKNLNDPTKCWEWIGQINHSGYGRISFQGIEIQASRASYLVHYGAVPSELFVCHRCDNPKCVNPNHLFLGTAKDNTRDMMKKGRMKGWATYERRGQNNGQAKLTDQDAKYIFSSDKSLKELAEQFRVDLQTIYSVRCGKTFANVNDKTKFVSRNPVKLSQEQVEEIRHSTERGTVLAKKFGIGESYVYKIRKGLCRNQQN